MGGLLTNVRQVREQRFKPGREHFDAAGEIAVGNHAGNCDGEAEDGGVERLGNAARDGEVVGGVAQALEDGDQAGRGA